MTRPSAREVARPVNYICRDCALQHGAAWPPGHCATVSISECPVCRRKTGIASVDDWDWPQGKPKGWRGGGRD